MQHIERKLSVKHEALEKHTEVHGKAYTGQTSYIKVNTHTVSHRSPDSLLVQNTPQY